MTIPEFLNYRKVSVMMGYDRCYLPQVRARRIKLDRPKFLQVLKLYGLEPDTPAAVLPRPVMTVKRFRVLAEIVSVSGLAHATGYDSSTLYRVWGRSKKLSEKMSYSIDSALSVRGWRRIL